MGIIARVRRRKKGEHLRQAEHEWWRQAEHEREAEKHYQGQAEQAEQCEEGDWWRVLEVSPDTGVDGIRDAYRRKIRQYHPDRVSGVAPEFLELAERRTKALNTAYSQAVRAQRGIHPLQRVWPPIMIGVMFVVEVGWIGFLVYLSIKFFRFYF